MDFQTELLAKRDKIDRILLGALKTLDSTSPTLLSAAAYAVKVGGKRLRPIMFMAAYEHCGGTNIAAAEDFACAIEFLHTYTLVHDDLPEMDNDDFRRGKPSCHKKFGVSFGLLAGDALVNLAYQCFLRAATSPEFLRAATYFSECGGMTGVLGGQAAEFEYITTNRLPDMDARERIYKGKTAALFRGACVGGALAAGANAEKIAVFERFSENFGIAFQLKDDALDSDGAACENEVKQRFEFYSNEARLAAEKIGSEFFVKLTEYGINRIN